MTKIPKKTTIQIDKAIFDKLREYCAAFDMTYNEILVYFMNNLEKVYLKALKEKIEVIKNKIEAGTRS